MTWLYTLLGWALVFDGAVLIVSVAAVTAAIIVWVTVAIIIGLLGGWKCGN